MFLFPGVQSGFVTLPRPSRFERQLQDGDIWKRSSADNGGATLTRSDSLASFTVDLGPSLMAEVFALIDNSSSLQISCHSKAACEEEAGEEEEKGDTNSLTETPAQTPTASSPNPSLCSGSFRPNVNGRSSTTGIELKEDNGAARTPDVSYCSSHKEESVMEAERFQRAADVVARHYGGGSFTRGMRINPKTPHVLSEEEEIKL